MEHLFLGLGLLPLGRSFSLGQSNELYLCTRGSEMGPKVGIQVPCLEQVPKKAGDRLPHCCRNVGASAD